MHTFSSYIAMGDSFTEGLNDQLPDGTYLGWADRLATLLAEGKPHFKYANIALRGKRLQQVIDEQLPVALELRPDLVTVCAGGNDIILPGADVDLVTAGFDDMIRQLREAGIHVAIFTGPDTKPMGVLNRLRGKIAIYSANLRATAERHGASVVDLWAMDVLNDPYAWSEDRLHFTPEAHERISLRAVEVLGVVTHQDWRRPLREPDSEHEAAAANWASMRRSDIEWTWAHLLPWIRRRLRGQSMADGREPKRPELTPLRGADDGPFRTTAPTTVDGTGNGSGSAS